MTTVTLTIGVPTSGKSTWANKECIRNRYETVQLNRDDIRIALFLGNDRSLYDEYTFTDKCEAVVTAVQSEGARRAVAAGLNVIISDTNLSAATRRRWRQFTKDNDVDYVERFFHISRATADARNRVRDVTIPDDVMDRMYTSYLKLCEGRRLCSEIPN